MSTSWKAPTARRDSISRRPASQPPRLTKRVLISDCVTSPELVRTTTTTTSVATTTAATKATSTLLLQPSTSSQPTPARMDVSLDDVSTKLQPQTTFTVSTSVSTTTTTTTSAAAPGTTTVIINAGNDSAFLPSPFRAVDWEDAGVWLRQFEKYTAYRGSSDADKLHLLALLLRDTAGNWYDELNDDIKTDWATLKDAFQSTFRGHRNNTTAQIPRTMSTGSRTDGER